MVLVAGVRGFGAQSLGFGSGYATRDCKRVLCGISGFGSGDWRFGFRVSKQGVLGDLGDCGHNEKSFVCSPKW